MADQQPPAAPEPPTTADLESKEIWGDEAALDEEIMKVEWRDSEVWLQLLRWLSHYKCGMRCDQGGDMRCG